MQKEEETKRKEGKITGFPAHFHSKASELGNLTECLQSTEDLAYCTVYFFVAPWQWEKFGPRLSAEHSDYFLFSSFPAWNQGLGEKKVGSDENLRTKGLLWVTSINKVLHIPIDPHIYHSYTKG